VLAVGCGLALGASFVDFRLFILPWIAIAPLLAIAERARPRRALRLGWLAGGAGIALAFAWLTYAFRVFGGFSVPVAWLLFFPPVAWMGLQLGLFTALVSWIGPLPLGVTAPLAFTAVEFLYPSLFPWRLAHSQYRVTPLLQSGELAGPTVLGFAIVWVNAALLATYRAMKVYLEARRGVGVADGTTWRAARGTIVAPLALAAILVACGVWRLRDVRATRLGAPALRVGIVQGNIGVERKGDRSFFARNLDEYRTLSRAVTSEVDLLVWPETVVQQRIGAEQSRLTGAIDPFPDAGRPLLFGGLTLAYDRGGRRHVYNSAFLRDTDGRILGRYDKRVLVPFGEYMPFGDRFPRLRELSPATSSFSAGTGPTVLRLGSGAGIGALICYEDVIPGPTRTAVADGATLLVNLTNDAWYGDSAEPVQHQALAAWRAVETRRDLVRSTNTGLTSVIAASGDVVAELPTFASETLVTDVRLLSGTTVYAAVGDVVAWTAVATLLAVVLIRVRAARRRTAEPSRRRRRSRGPRR
jgi:apolipoprotein N-acyltransferase